MGERRHTDHATSWEDVADWYRQISGRKGPELATRVVYPEVLRFAGDLRGRRVLDVGCGPGALTRLLAYRGAHAIGVDASERMIELARRDAREAEVEPAPVFQVGDARDRRTLPKGPFDLATLVLALQNMERPEQVLASVATRLRSGGRLVLALNHPCFRIPGSTHWGWDPEAQAQFRRVDAYRSRRKVEIQIHPGSDPEATRPSFHWPLETLFGALRQAGLAVVDLSEPASDRVSEGGRAEAENRARREIPLFLVILAERGRKRPRRRRTSG
jgi:SAM-dependent methyltransferase